MNCVNINLRVLIISEHTHTCKHSSTHGEHMFGTAAISSSQPEHRTDTVAATQNFAAVGIRQLLCRLVAARNELRDDTQSYGDEHVRGSMSEKPPETDIDSSLKYCVRALPDCDAQTSFTTRLNINAASIFTTSRDTTLTPHAHIFTLNTNCQTDSHDLMR